MVSGNIELTEVNIAFKTAGRLIERTVDEGDTVKKGQVIARLDRDQLLAQRDREAAGLAIRPSRNWRRRETALEWQKATLAGDIEQRKADLAANRGAAAGTEERLPAAGESRRRKPRWTPRSPKSTAPNRTGTARRRSTRTTTSPPRSSTSSAPASKRRRRAEAGARSAQALVLAGPRAEADRGASRRRWNAPARRSEDGRSQLARNQAARAGTDHPRAPRSARSKASLALIDSQLADTIAVSPVDGVVLVKSADPGEVLAPGTTVVTVGDIDHPWLRGYVNETDLGR